LRRTSPTPPFSIISTLIYLIGEECLEANNLLFK